ncbi:MAG: TonBC domain-containing protein [Nitrospira sp.]|nr:MAG: TonBC domain-containing protein [Nitrospira sp.]
MSAIDECERVPYSAWSVSLGLHAVIVGLAFMVTAQVQPILKEEIFQWDVALIQPVSEPPRSEPAPPAQMAQPSKPAPVRAVQTPQPIPPVEPASDMVMTRVATQYSPEIIHPTIVPPKPEPVKELIEEKPKPVESQETKKEEIRKEEAKPQDIVKPEPVREIAQAHEPSPAPVAKELAPPTESVATTAQAYEPPALAPVHHAAPVIHRETVSPEEMAPEWRPLVAVRGRPEEAAAGPAAAAPVVAEPNTEAAAPTPTKPQAQAPMVASVAPVRPATKADNAWLAESLGRRIKELTRYPNSARLNGTEGKVVLRVILRADGHLAGVTVHRSSGHDVLDRAAMETVRLACPIHMKQALSAAEVAVYVPIVYSLAG